MKKCVFAGTFDPPTKGHKSVIEKCAKIFDEVVVAVMVNGAKSPYLEVDERIALLQKLFKGEKGVRVRYFGGAVADLLKEENTPFYARGVRNTVDFEYERSDYFASKLLCPDMVEIFIPAEQDELHISSSMVKNFLAFKKDFSGFIPEEILEDFLKMTEKKDV